jgi:hypothetical protein
MVRMGFAWGVMIVEHAFDFNYLVDPTKCPNYDVFSCGGNSFWRCYECSGDPTIAE